jgi:arylsulfatase A-like enzyme
LLSEHSQAAWRKTEMNLVRQSLVVAACAAAILGSRTSQVRAVETDPRPNVVLIVLDDLGWADLGCYGSQFHKSPNIDRLAKEGMRFTQAYAAAPVCSPTRAALMTGKWPARLHVTDWLPGIPYDEPGRRLAKPKQEKQLPLAEVTLAERLQAAGYATGHIGKWHLGGKGFGPRNQGFDLNVGGDEKGTPKGYFAPFCERMGDVPHIDWAPPGSYLTDIVNDAAIRFIREHREQPFFLDLSHFAVHTPLRAKPQTVAKYKLDKPHPGQQSNPTYAAMIESVDEGIGKIVKELEKLKLREKTILIFTSDNGGVATADWPMAPPTVNGSLREGKGHLYEGGIRVPLIVLWPGRVPASAICETPVTSVDFVPTILELCGVGKAAHFQELTANQETLATKEQADDVILPVATAAEGPLPQLDGVSLLPLLTQAGDISREALYWHYPHYSPQHGRPSGAIRVGDYKLIVYYEDLRRELYNLKSDPGETNNLAEQENDKVREFAGKFSAWRSSVGAQLMKPNPFYHPNPQQDDGTVSLHARAADIHGSMLRFQSPPHLDSLGHWKKQEDWASFEFELTDAGKFDVELLYCCTKEDAGSKVDITLGGQKLTQIVEATQERKFVPRVVGSVELKRVGRHYLTIKPQSKPGELVMDLRRVRLLPLK